MDNHIVLLHGKEDASLEVRALLLQDTIKVYDAATNALLGIYPCNDTSLENKGSTTWLYLDASHRQYLELPADHLLLYELRQRSEKAGQGTVRKLIRHKALTLLAVLVVVIAGLYFLMISFVPYLGLKLIGTNREIALGQRLHDMMIEQSRLAGETVDSQGSARLQAFADKLNLSSKYPVKLTLVKSKTVNAYAVPGGNIVVYTGILEKLETPEALAALLSHEATHVNERHSLRSLLRGAASKLLVAVVVGDAGAATAIIASNVESLNGLSYSRSLEEEADEKGMELLLYNRVRLEGMPQLMRTLEAEAGAQGIPSFLSSHPATGDRIRNAESFIRSHAQQPVERKDLDTLFAALKQSGGRW
ncbi:MAG TPA: M48 family metallopeptidase [Flavisolibacter sp.]|nr:M48 family metallopeptidase [Flavisolibacter sp.]